MKTKNGVSLWVHETYVNLTENRIFSESGWYEAFTSDRGELFKFCRNEYGKCTGQVYRASDDKAVGWSFEKKCTYTDSPDTYIREVWVQVREVPADKKLVQASSWIEVDK